MPSSPRTGLCARRNPLARYPELVLAAGISIVLSAWLFGPALADLRGHIVGEQYSEQYTSAWVNRVFAEGLLEHFRLPWQVDEVVFEKGVILHLSLPTLLLSLPLYPFVNANGLFTLAMLANFLLAFFGAFFLFRHLAKDRWSAFPGALLFALSPYALDHLARGPFECSAIGWIPIALLCVEKYPGQTLRQALFTGAMLMLVFTANTYYGLFTFIAAGALLLGRDDLTLFRRLRRAAITMGLAATLIAPFAWGFLAAIEHPRSLTPGRTLPRDPLVQREILTRGAVVDLASVVLPTQTFRSPFIDKSVYIGVPTLLLCIVGFFRVRRSRRWFWLGLGSFLFAMGASLKVGGAFFQLGAEPVPMPARLLLLHVPPFTMIYSPFRALPLTFLGAGAVITLLFARGGMGRPRVHLVLVSLALSTEMLFGLRDPLRLPTAPNRAPRFYRELAKDPGRYGVVDLPAPQSDEEHGRYLLYQLVHRKRVPYNFQGHFAFVREIDKPIDESQNLTLRLQIPNAPRRLDEELRRFSCRLDCSWVRTLRRYRYRYLTLHRTGHKTLDRRMTECLERCVTDLERDDGEVRVYRAPPLVDPP